MAHRLLLLFALLLLNAQAFSQCAMCKAVAADAAAEEGSTVNKAIMYIMTIPYIILFVAFRKKIFGFFKKLRSIPEDNRR